MHNKTYRILLLFITFITLLFACQKEEVNRPFARLRTLPVTEIDSTGATFHAEVIDFNEEAIIDHGFIWTTYSQTVINLPPERFSHQSLGVNLEKKEFSTRIESGLQAGISYYVRAYLRSAKGTVYGEEIIFISQGGFVPLIEKILPEILTPGDTMIIEGKYFADIKEQGKVWIGQQEAAEIIDETSTEIRCIVPLYIEDNAPVVVQSLTGQKSAAFPIPKISSPELYHLIPAEIVIGDTVTMEGRYFSLRKEWNEIISENTGGSFEIVNVTSTKLQFIPSIGAFGGTARFQVRVGWRASTTGLDFSLAAPIIEDFYPKEGTVGDTLTIIGKNFHPDNQNNRISFNEDIEGFGYVVNSTKRELKILIQEMYIGLSERMTGKISVSVGGKKATSQASFTYLNRDWKILTELPNALSYSPLGFVLQDKLYFSDNGSTWWTYNISSRSWQLATQIPQVGNEGYSTIVALAVGEEAFIVQRNTNNPNPLQFWRYRPAGNEWKRAPDIELPSGALVNDPLVAFSVGQEVFLCLSGRENPCFKLNIATGVWSPIASYIPLLTSEHDGFTPVPLAATSYNQNGYLLSPQGGPRFLMEYKPVDNTWTKIDDYLYNAYPRQHGSFVYRNKVYFLSFNIPNLFVFEWDTFIRKSRYYPLHSPPTDVNFGEGQAFVVSDRVFIAISKYLYEWFPR